MNEGIEYKKLLVAYEALQTENLTLKGEVEKLRRQLALVSEGKPSESQIPVPKEIHREADVSKKRRRAEYRLPHALQNRRSAP